MDDKHIMADILETEKYLTNNTVVAMHEASSESLYNLYAGFSTKLSKEVKEIFGISYNNNWYQLEAAERTKINGEITKLCDELNKEE